MVFCWLMMVRCFRCCFVCVVWWWMRCFILVSWCCCVIIVGRVLVIVFLMSVRYMCVGWVDFVGWCFVLWNVRWMICVVC